MLTDLELRHIRLLLESRVRVQDRLRFYDERLEDFVRDLRDQGASARTIAEQIGVSPATVQLWTQHARARSADRTAD